MSVGDGVMNQEHRLCDHELVPVFEALKSDAVYIAPRNKSKVSGCEDFFELKRLIEAVNRLSSKAHVVRTQAAIFDARVKENCAT